MSFLARQPTAHLRAFLSVAGLLACLDTVYHVSFHQLDVSTLLLTVVLESLTFTAVFFICQTVHLTRITLAYLALPYALFFPFWLNASAASVMMITMAIALGVSWKLAPAHNASLNNTFSITSDSINVTNLLGFLGLLVWLNLSGVGGYGYQSPDYGMHNGRLKDLIDFSWPVRYNPDANLVYYVGYYLPSAALGKLFGPVLAMRSMLPWTLLGVSLALRWLTLLTGTRHTSLLLVAVFILFGPQDMLGVLFAAFFNNNAQLAFSQWSFWETTDDMDFWVSPGMPFFLGNFVSNTFQLYWAPHQIVVGWLSGALALQAFTSKNTSLLIFPYALLCLWSPTVMLALFPLMLGITLILLRDDFKGLFSLPNLFAVLLLTPVFAVFYTSGSALTNPYHWTLAQLTPMQWLLFGLFHLLSWGLYTVACWPYLRQASRRERYLAGLVLGNFALLSLLVYGEWSDLICRGAAPLSFCLLVLLLRAWTHYRIRRRTFLQTLLGLFLIAGTGSALLQNTVAIKHYGEAEKAIRGDQYSLSYQFLGPDNSLFGRYLRRHP